MMMVDRLPPNVEDGLRDELRGLEARLVIAVEADDSDRVEYLTGRIGQVKSALGEEAPKRRGRPGRETKPGHIDGEVRG